MIVVKQLKKSFKQGENTLTLLTGIDLTIHQGEFVSLCGPSGSGKTTLLNILSTLEPFDSGEVWVDNKAIAKLNDNQRSDMRANDFGFIFQDFRLISSLNVLENVKVAMALKKDNNVLDPLEVLNDVGLSDKHHSKIHTLSGGEKQRVGIARALVSKPKVIFADEPTGNLDQITTIKVMDTLKSMHEKYQTTIIMVTHDLSTTHYGNRTIRLLNGSLVEDD